MIKLRSRRTAVEQRWVAGFYTTLSPNGIPNLKIWIWDALRCCMGLSSNLCVISQFDVIYVFCRSSCLTRFPFFCINLQNYKILIHFWKNTIEVRFAWIQMHVSVEIVIIIGTLHVVFLILSMNSSLLHTLVEWNTRFYRSFEILFNMHWHTLTSIYAVMQLAYLNIFQNYFVFWASTFANMHMYYTLQPIAYTFQSAYMSS